MILHFYHFLVPKRITLPFQNILYFRQVAQTLQLGYKFSFHYYYLLYFHSKGQLIIFHTELLIFSSFLSNIAAPTGTAGKSQKCFCPFVFRYLKKVYHTNFALHQYYKKHYTFFFNKNHTYNLKSELIITYLSHESHSRV